MNVMSFSLTLVHQKAPLVVANAKCLGVPRAQGEIILVTNASNVGGGGTLFQWQALEKEELDSAISQWGTDGLNRDGTLKHSPEQRDLM